MSGARMLEDNEIEGEGGEPQADLEARARRMGWSPKEEFRGDPARWTSAEDFIRRGEEELPIARERARKADRMLEESKKDVSELRGMLQEMRLASQKNEERAYQRAKAELLAQREAAVQSADTASFKQADARLTELEAEKPASVPKPANTNGTTAPAPHPDEIAWVNRQSWWGKNQQATAMAVQLHSILCRENPGAVQDNLSEVERRVRGAFPEAFPPVRRESPAQVSGSADGGAPPTKKGKLSFDNMPAEDRGLARKAFAKIKRQLPDYTEEEYLRDYDWG